MHFHNIKSTFYNINVYFAVPFVLYLRHKHLQYYLHLQELYLQLFDISSYDYEFAKLFGGVTATVEVIEESSNDDIIKSNLFAYPYNDV